MSVISTLLARAKQDGDGPPGGFTLCCIAVAPWDIHTAHAFSTQALFIFGAILAVLSPLWGVFVNGAATVLGYLSIRSNRGDFLSYILILLSSISLLVSLAPVSGACDTYPTDLGPFEVRHCRALLQMFEPDLSLTTTHFTLR